jgi:hypothetical protein
MTRHKAQSAECTGTQLDELCDSMCTKAPRSDAASSRASATDPNAGSSSWNMAVRIRPKRWRRVRGIKLILMGEREITNPGEDERVRYVGVHGL